MPDPSPTLFDSLPPDDPIFEAVVPLFAHDNAGHPWASGTAVFVAPGLAITALHVLTDFWKRFDGIELDAAASRELVAPSGFSVMATQRVGSTRVLWDVSRMWTADPLDIAIIELERHDKQPLPVYWNLPPLRFSPPTVGDEFVAVGFHMQRVNFKGEHKLVWDHDAAVAGGVVDEVHTAFRDRVNLNCPCFRTNARFDAGMSGGPVIDAEGRIFGIVSTSFELQGANEGHISYASLLWPSLALEIAAPSFLAGATGLVPFSELFRVGGLRSPDWQRVRVGDDGNTVILT